MGFQVVYVAGGELDKVKYVDRIRNFAYLSRPYNKMLAMNVPAIKGVYEIDYVTPEEDVELLSFVVTCSGYGENDYYNIYVNGQKWWDTWFPTEVKEGLYIGTSTYVCQLPPGSGIKVQFINITGTAKKVWFGIRMFRQDSDEDDSTEPVILDTLAVAEPVRDLRDTDFIPVPDNDTKI